MKKLFLLSLSLCFAALLQAQSTATVVANCDNGSVTAFGTTWYAFNDSAGGGASKIVPLTVYGAPFTMTSPGANNSDSAAVITYTLGQGTYAYTPFVGFGFNVMPDGISPFDLTGSTGISFYHKGDSVSLQLGLTTVTDYANFAYTVPAHTTWTLVTIPWTSFAQPFWESATVPFDVSQIISFQWEKQDASGIQGTIGIDQVQINGIVLFVDSSALVTGIANVKGLLKSVTIGTAVGDYPASSAAALTVSLDSAIAVDGSKTATQAQVNTALGNLHNAAVAFQASIIAKTIVLPWNYYGLTNTDGHIHDFQLQNTIALPTNYNAQIGDVLTITIAGTSNYDISRLSVVVVNPAPPTYWTPLTVFDSLTTTKAGVPFNITTHDTITAASAAGTFNVVLDAVSLTALDTTGGQVTLSLSNYVVSIKKGYDATKLDSLIAIAQADVNAAVVGTAFNNYPASSVSALNSAITTAQAAETSNSPTQTSIDAAGVNLTAAISTFQASVISQGTVVLNWNQYAAKNPNGHITDFQKQNTIELPSDYAAQIGDILIISIAGISDYDISKLQVAIVNPAPPSYWTQLSAFDSLTSVPAGVSFSTTITDTIIAASASGTFNVVLDANSTTALDTTGGQITLTLSKYTVSIQSGRALDSTELATKIAKAQTYVKSAVIGLANGDFTTSAVTTLQTAIKTAQAAEVSTTATQASFIAALSAISTAISTFKASAIIVDFSALAAEITTSQSDLSNAIIGAANGNYPQSTAIVLKTAIKTAQTLETSTTATQANADAATTTLATADSVFKASVLHVYTIGSVLANCENTSFVQNYQWYSFNDSGSKGASTITPLSPPFIMSKPGANGTDSAAVVTYSLSKGGNTGNPYTGFGFNVNPDGKTPCNLSGSNGISFYHKGDSVTIQVGLATITDYAYYAYNIPAQTTWTVVSIPWTAFAQPNWGTKVAFDPSQIVKIQWTKTDPTGYAGTIGIDEITINNAATVYKAALVAEIDSAQIVYNAAAVGTENGQYPAKAKTALQSAIAVANSVNSSTATQSHIDSATVSLKNAVAAFKASQIYLYTIIADCENADVTSMNTSWFSFNDNGGSGKSTVSPLSSASVPFTMTAPGANGTGYAAVINYALNQGTESYMPFVGMGFSLSNQGSIDLTGSTGISFYHKGDSVTLMVDQATITDYANYQYIIPPHKDWTFVTIPWSSFAQPGWGKVVPLNLTQITFFQWEKHDITGTNGMIGIDQVQINGLGGTASSFIPTVILPTTAITQASNGGTRKLAISANTTWKATSNEPWLTVTPDTVVTGINSIMVTSAPNSGAVRTATVNISAVGMPTQTITVTQGDTISLVKQIANVTLALTDIPNKYLFADYINYTSASFNVVSSNQAVAVPVVSGTGFGLVLYGAGTANITVAAISSGGVAVSLHFTVTVTSTSTANCSSLKVTPTQTQVTCPGGSNGSIELSASGGAAPYNFKWSNTHTGDNLAAIPAGTYSVIVTDSNACTIAETYTITQPTALAYNQTVIAPSCGGTDGGITLAVTGGTAPYKYKWSDGATSAAIASKAAGLYSVSITDKAGCYQSETFALSNTNAPVVTVDSLVSSQCGQNNGHIRISITGGAAPYSFMWGDGTTTQNRSAVASGNYALTVTDNAGCVATFDTLVPANTFAPPSIALVTVNQLTGKNLVVWQKENTSAITYYTIYRETVRAGQYEPTGKVLYGSLSVFEDDSVSSLEQAWRYRLSATDNCGNESPLSAEHKTINLQQNLGLGGTVNLDWDAYEGIDFYTYIIYRQTADGTMSQIKEIPSSITRYTDVTPPANVKAYYVAILLPDTIDPLQTLKSDAGPYSQSLSNMAESQLTVVKTQSNNNITLYPNPTSTSFRVTVGEPAQVHIYTVSGTLVLSKHVSGNEQIATNGLPTGLYVVKIITGKDVVTRSLIVE